MAVSLSEGKHFVDGVCLPGFTSVEHLKELKKLSLDPSDILVTGYPRSGILIIYYYYCKSYIILL